MGKSMIVLVVIMLGIGLVSGLLTYWRAPSLATPDALVAKGLAIIRRERVTFYGLFLPVLVGTIAYFVYCWMSARWPSPGDHAFWVLALVVALGFTLLAALVFRLRGFVEMTALHAATSQGSGGSCCACSAATTRGHLLRHFWDAAAGRDHRFGLATWGTADRARHFFAKSNCSNTGFGPWMRFQLAVMRDE
jgi:hypothetical protein